MARKKILVAPRDLLEKIVSSNERSGWFAGMKLKEEPVFIAFALKLKDEEMTSSNRRLLPHRGSNLVLGTYEDQLVRWIVPENGFDKKYASNDTVSADEYDKTIGIEIGSGSLWFAAVERDDAGVVLTSRTARRIEGDRVRLRRTDSAILEDLPDPFVRLPDGIVQNLQGKSVMVVGVGSGGSEIALNLASSGIGRLDLVDHDRLGPENYIRFPAGKLDLGRHKVDVVRSMIEERELPTEVRVHYLDVITQADEFRGIVSSSASDLVICATDSIKSRRLVNCTAVQMGLPTIIAGTLDNGRIVEVLRILPHKSACYECVRLELGAVLEQPRADEISTTPYVDSRETRVESGTLRMDIAVGASLASHVALQMLNPERFPPMPAP